MPTKTDERSGNGGNGGPAPAPTLTAAGDPLPVSGQPLILNDAYFELNGVNLRCLVKHLEVARQRISRSLSPACAQRSTTPALPNITCA